MKLTLVLRDKHNLQYEELKTHENEKDVKSCFIGDFKIKMVCSNYSTNEIKKGPMRYFTTCSKR